MLDQITKATANSIEMSLAELQTLASPTFLFAFENRASGVAVTCIAADTSSYPTRYNKFTITEQASPTALNGEVELEPVGLFDVRVYEQTSTTNLSEALADNLLARDKVRVVINGDREATAFTIYDNPDDTYSFWDVDASEGIVVTPPTRDVTYENSNDSFSVVIPSGTTYVAADITWIDSDLSVNTAPANTDITCTPGAAGSGIFYQRPNFPGSRTSYADYDEAWQNTNNTYDYTNASPATIARLDLDNTYPFHFLVDNNTFGNKSRFTDENGEYYTNPFDNTTGTDPGVYSMPYVIDHLTGLAYNTSLDTAATWTAALTAANSKTFNSFSDWRMCNVNEYNVILCFDVDEAIPNKYAGLSYLPFALLVSEKCFTSTTVKVATTKAVMYFNAFTSDSGVLINRELKSASLRYYTCRNHFA